MKTQEEKVLEQLVNLTESHWFNPALFGRYMANQPIYTLDRIVEMMAHIVKNMELRKRDEEANGITSEGLILANELHHAIKAMKEETNFNNIKLPN